jgi:HlyD family secretion protein
VQNVVTYDVVVDVNNDDLALFPGMTADAHIITAERSNVLRVPLPAIRFNPEGLTREPRQAGSGREVSPGRQSDAGRDGARPDERGQERGENRRGAARGARARLWLLRDGKLLAVAVRTGLDDGTLIEVSSTELKAGDVVVVNAVRPNAAPAQPVSNTPANPPAGNVRGGFRM